MPSQNPWMDSLSEDWVSQPRSSAPSTLSNGAPSRPSSLGSINNSIHSRIPRLRSASGAPSLRSSTSSSNQSIRRPQGKRKSVLSERSLSEDNILSSSSVADTDSKTTQIRVQARTVSATSADSVIRHGNTAEEKLERVSPGRRKTQGTPEWKRRLLKGEMGYGDQKDLFSPMGLENIFQKPQGSPSGRKQEPKGLSFLKSLEAMPSSPPPWPSALPQPRSPPKGDPYGSPTQHLEALEEAGEESDECGEGEDVSVQQELGSDHTQTPSYGLGDSELQLTVNKKPYGNILEGGHRGAPTQKTPAGMFKSEASDATDSDRPLQENSRTFSGQTELRNEGFSPVSLSDLNAADGKHNHAPVGPSKSDLDHRLNDLARRGAENSEVSDARSSELQEESLPVDLPAGTPDGLHIGNFVSVKRGGYSADSSFRRRPLSASKLSHDISQLSLSPDPIQPVAIPDESSVLPQSVPPQAPTPPNAPATPPPREADARDNHERTRSSGSPLKLFGDHDTFTANKLQRRMSQLEEPSELERGVSASHIRCGSPEKRPSRERRAEPRLSSVEESHTPVTGQEKADTRNQSRYTSQGSNFGQGELDDHPFPDDFSFSVFDHDDAGADPSMSPPPDVMPPGAQEPFRFRLEAPSGPHDTFRTKRKSSRQSVLSSASDGRISSLRIRKSPRLFSARSNPRITREESMSAIDLSKVTEGKRPSISPSKDPTPKRRRTSHALEDQIRAAEIAESTKEAYENSQRVNGKKRKDARQDNSRNLADADVLAERRILRPRNPTPRQRRRHSLNQEIVDATDAFLSSSPKLEAIKEHLKSPAPGHGSPDAAEAKAVAGEIAAFNIRIHRGMDDNSRKRSVTTQDFLDEAMKIMDYIRNKGRPNSGLANLPESESEHHGPDDGSALTLNELSFSRPPSREGPRWRDPTATPQITDPLVVDRLQRFQEKQDEDFMVSTFKTLPVKQDSPLQNTGTEHPLVQGNVHIIEKPIASETREDAQSHNKPADEGVHFDSAKTSLTYGSGDSSLGKTNVTNTSRKSDHVATLAPGAVAHLIPEQVAGMHFDKVRGMWVRISSRKKETEGGREASAITESEDDPFKEIPDLTVDETKEVNHTTQKAEDDVATMEAVPQQVPQLPTGTSVVDQAVATQRPHTRDGAEPPLVSTSSVPSKFSHFASSQSEAVETRATSWSTANHSLRRSKAAMGSQFRPDLRIDEADFEDVERDMTAREGHDATRRLLAAGNTPYRPRTVAVPFSSPVTDLEGPDEAGRDFDAEDENLESSNSGDSTGTVRHRDVHVAEASESRTSIQALSHEPVPSSLNSNHIPRIEECSELSLAPLKPNQPFNFAVSVSTPRQAKDPNLSALVVPSSSSPCRNGDVTFYLSELPSFTVHQVDELELPTRTIAKRPGRAVVGATESRYHQGTVDLVKALQDTEPDEPYWDELRSIDLRDNNLASLHMLDEFCCRVEEADASGNQLAQLVGVPATVRSLNVAKNALTSLTSWGHLLNLQYLDVSGNDLDSLEAFGCLYHLRELRADGNRIEAMDGVLELDALLSLSLRNNQLQKVDFTDANLKRLTHLDLSENELSDIRGLSWLPELVTLDLGNNHLEAFPSDSHIGVSNPHLKSLRLAHNRLMSVVLEDGFPSLAQVYLDHNRQPAIQGLSNLRKLTILSLREQTPECGAADHIAQLENTELHTLNLSATPLFKHCLTFPNPLYNLRHLELASCGLESLPTDFGSSLAPNLRHLNLNFNALRDLRPLLGLRQLTTLLLAGNRVARLRTTAGALSRFSTTLRRLDLRDNPLTVGFYAPAVAEPLAATRSLSLTTRKSPTNAPSDECDEPYTLPPMDADRDAKYAARLDEGTRLRRRVYEILLATRCVRLAEVDGMAFEKRTALRKDQVWGRLVELGVVRRSEEEDGGKGCDVEQERQEEGGL